MIANSDIRPERILKYGITGKGQINFLIEKKETQDAEGNPRESYDYRSVEVSSFAREAIINAVVREKYSQSEVEAIFANYLAGDDQGEYESFQHWRKLAKAVADGASLAEDLTPLLQEPVADRVAVIEDLQADIVTVLNEKGIVP